MSSAPIRDYMTAAPHTISMETSLPEARKKMASLNVRHLPVRDGSRLVGLLSERDLVRLEGFAMVNLALISVADAMTTDLYIVAPETPAIDVCRTMRDKRLGSALVSENDEVVGVFTTTDALDALIATMT